MDSKLTQSQMEAILKPDSVLFEALVSNLLSSSEEKRSEAESIIDKMQQKAPDSLAIKLADFIGSNSLDIASREKCSVLLQRLITENDERIWRNLSALTQSSLKCILLDHIRLVESRYITRELCCAVSKMATSLLPYDNWPKLLPFLKECASSKSNRLIESFFFIFAQLDVDTWKTFIPDISIPHSVFQNTMNENALDLKVRTAVLITAIKFIQCLPRSIERQRFQNLLPAMLRTLNDALSNGEEVLANHVLRFFIDLAKNEPRFLRMQLADVVHTMFDIVEDKSLKDLTRQIAAVFIITLVEAKEKAPGMIKKLPLFINTCFAVSFNLLVDIKDEPTWHSAETEHENAGETKIHYCGRWFLRQLSIALGGKTITLIAIEKLGDYLVAPEWEKRYSALVALYSIAQGSSKVMIKYLEQVLNMVLDSFQDPHPRVRWAAIDAISIFSCYFSPDLQEKYHNQVLPALAAAVDDFQNPRVQAQAATAICNFCESQKSETLLPHLDGLLNKLLVLLQNDKQMVQEAALNALSGIADFSKEHFQKYYDFVMLYLKTILTNANDKSNHILRNKVLKCISFVGMAVGKEIFRDDLKQVMEVLEYSLQESQVKESNKSLYSLRALSRICGCMEKDFLPFMSTIMPPLVECAQFEPDKTVSSDDLDDSLHKVKFGNEIICIRGSDLLKIKSIACGLLGSYAQILEEDFYPWNSQAASILVPLLKFYLDNDVRENAIDAMNFLLHSAKHAEEHGIAQGGNRDFKQLAVDIILALGNALYSEPEAKICASISRELNKCLEICGPLLNGGQLHSIVDAIKHVITESSRRKGEFTERAKSEDFDAEEAELMREERELEEEVVKNVGNILITFIKTFKAAFLPFVDELSAYLMPMAGKDKTVAERSKCFHIFDQVMENCGEAALKYYPIYLPFLLGSSDDENPVVRQNALYGLGFCAAHGGSVFKPFVGEALSRISVVITHLHAREPENLWPYYNGVYALCKICQFHRESIDSPQIIPAWLNCLPIKYDMVEAKLVHDQLCSMVERSDREVLGPNYLHLPKVISVFAEVLSAKEDLVTEETANRMIELLRHLMKTLAPATLASAWSLLLPQQEMELLSILSPEEDVNISIDAMKLLVW